MFQECSRSSTQIYSAIRSLQSCRCMQSSANHRVNSAGFQAVGAFLRHLNSTTPGGCSCCTMRALGLAAATRSLPPWGLYPARCTYAYACHLAKNYQSEMWLVREAERPSRPGGRPARSAFIKSHVGPSVEIRPHFFGRRLRLPFFIHFADYFLSNFRAAGFPGRGKSNVCWGPLQTLRVKEASPIYAKRTTVQTASGLCPIVLHSKSETLKVPSGGRGGAGRRKAIAWPELVAITTLISSSGKYDD